MEKDCFPHIEDEFLRQFLNKWLDMRGKKTTPYKGDIDPLEFKELLPFLWLCEYQHDTKRFKYHLIGEQTRNAYDRPVAQHYLDEMLDQNSYGRVFGYFFKCIKEPAIVHLRGLVYSERIEPAYGERLMLPFMNDDDEVTFILGATKSDFNKQVVREHTQIQYKTVTYLDGRATEETSIAI